MAAARHTHSVAVAMGALACVLAGARLSAAEAGAGGAVTVRKEELPGAGGLVWLKQSGAAVTAISGHTPAVKLRQQVGGAGEALLELSAWKGTCQDGVRRGTMAVLLGPPEKNAWLRLAEFNVRNGAGRGDRFSWGPQRAKDIFLRFGFAGEAQCSRFDAAQPAPAIVVHLAFRHGIGGGDEWTVGYGFGCAVVQIPAGKSFDEARKDPANVLFEPAVIKSLPLAEGGPAFRLQVRAQGGWLLAVDADLDGQADLDLTEASPGAKPWTVPGCTQKHGLLVNLDGAGGAAPDTVNVSTVLLGVKFSPDEPARAPRERWPLLVDRCETLPTDPCPVFGQRFFERLEVRAEKNKEQAETAALGARRFGLVASAAAPGETAKEHLLAQTGQPETCVRFAPRLAALDPAEDRAWRRTFVPNQRVLVAGGNVELRPAGVAAAAVAGTKTAGGALLKMPAPGRYDLAVEGRVRRTIAVGLTDLPELIGAQTSRPRVVEVWCPGPKVAGARVTAGTAGVTILDRAGPFVRLLVQPQGVGSSRLVVTGEAGEELGCAEVRCFSLGLGDEGGDHVVIDALAQGQETAVPFRAVMRPWTPGITVRFNTIDRVCAFANQAISMTVDSSGGLTSNRQPGFKVVEQNGEQLGQFDYVIILPHQGTGWAHNFGAVFPEEMPKPGKGPVRKGDRVGKGVKPPSPPPPQRGLEF